MSSIKCVMISAGCYGVHRMARSPVRGKHVQYKVCDGECWVLWCPQDGTFTCERKACPV